MVAAGVYLLVRVSPLLELAQSVLHATLAIGVATAILAGLISLFQANFKRSLAYSTVSQLGFMFAAIGLGADQPDRKTCDRIVNRLADLLERIGDKAFPRLLLQRLTTRLDAAGEGEMEILHSTESIGAMTILHVMRGMLVVIFQRLLHLDRVVERIDNRV